MKKSISFKFTPGTDEKKKLNQKGCAFLEANGVPGDAVQIQMVILWELITRGKELDNLPPTKTGMTIYLLIENNLVTVEVRKQVGESSLGQLNELDKTIQLIRGGHNLFEPYIGSLKASNKLRSEITNDFELARIAYETGAVIDFYVNEDNILNLSAVRSWV